MNTGLGAKIATAAAEAGLVVNALSGSVPVDNQIANKQEPIIAPLPGESVKDEDGEFTFVNNLQPNIAQEEDDYMEEISKPITDEEVTERISPFTTTGPATTDEQSPSDTEEIVEEKKENEGEHVYDGEFLNFEKYEDLPHGMPTIEEFSEQKIVSVEKLENELVVRSNSNYLNMVTIPKEGLFPDSYFIETKVDVREYTAVQNEQRRSDYAYRKTFSDLEGIGFEIEEIIKLEDTNGIKSDWGMVETKDAKTFVLLRVQYPSEMEVKSSNIDYDNHTFDFVSTVWDSYDSKAFGQTSFGDASFYGILQELNNDLHDGCEQYIDYWPGRDIKEVDMSYQGLNIHTYDSDGSYSSWIINTTSGETNYRKDVVDMFFYAQENIELEEIAEQDPKIAAIVGFADAINSYPGDEAVSDAFLEEMFKFNFENYGVRPLGVYDTKYPVEKLTKYLLNYRDENGKSWYDSYLQSLDQQGGSYGNLDDLIRQLNLLSSGVKIEDQPVQFFGLVNMISILGDLHSPNIQALPVKSLNEIIPEDFGEYRPDYNSLEYVSIKGAYNYEEDVLYRKPVWDFKNSLMEGDILINPIGGGVDSDGNPVGDGTFVFYTQSNEEESVDPSVYGNTENNCWVIDLDNGRTRIYKLKWASLDYSGISQFLLRSGLNHSLYLQSLDQE